MPGAPLAVVATMFPVAHRFAAESRVRIHLANADCYFFENPLSGEPSGAQTARQTAHVAIHTSLA